VTGAAQAHAQFTVALAQPGELHLNPARARQGVQLPQHLACGLGADAEGEHAGVVRVTDCDEECGD
jgi:hypothetical protein